MLTLISTLGALSAQASPKPDLQSIDVKHYDLRLHLNASTLSYDGEVSIEFVAQKHIRTVWFHAEDIEITKSYTNKNVDLKFKHRNGKVYLTLPAKINEGESATVKLSFNGKANQREQYGLFTVQRSGYLPAFYTQFETQGARQVFPCYDEPFDKASVDFHITADQRYTVLANGKYIGRKNVGKGEKEVHYKFEKPLSTYLYSVVAAQLTAARSTYYSRKLRKSIPLTIYVDQNRTSEVNVALHALRESMTFFEEYFDRAFPWEQYSIVALDGFSWGGMENAGIANINASYLYWSDDSPYSKQVNILSLIAHELAHEWFGNLVTMNWWNDLWLNEAFASFMEQKLSAYVFGEDYERISNYDWLKRDYFAQDQGPFAHSIVPKRIKTLHELFDGVTYAKGVQVVKMLERYLGEEVFQQGIRDYLNKYQFKNASTNQFISSMSEVSGRPLEDFAEGWLDHPGYPLLTVDSSWNAEERKVDLSVSQESSAKSGRSASYVGTIELGLISNGDLQVVEMELQGKESGLTLRRENKVQEISINRDGSFLSQLKSPPSKEELEKILRTESSSMAQINSIEKWIETKPKPKIVGELLQDFLTSASLELNIGVADILLRSQNGEEWLRGVALEIQSNLIASLRSSPREPLLAELEEKSLTLLGIANDPSIYGLLRARLGHSVADVQRGALAGLLRTTLPARFSNFRETFTRERFDRFKRTDLLTILASTPDSKIFSHLGVLLNDEKLFPKDDSTTPIRVFSTLRKFNSEAVITNEGIEFIADQVRRNFDRPSVASAALRALEDIGDANKEQRKFADKIMSELLKEKPDKDLESMIKRIKKAA